MQKNDRDSSGSATTQPIRSPRSAWFGGVYGSPSFLLVSQIALSSSQSVGFTRAPPVARAGNVQSNRRFAPEWNGGENARCNALLGRAGFSLGCKYAAWLALGEVVAQFPKVIYEIGNLFALARRQSGIERFRSFQGPILIAQFVGICGSDK